MRNGEVTFLSLRLIEAIVNLRRYNFDVTNVNKQPAPSDGQGWLSQLTRWATNADKLPGLLWRKFNRRVDAGRLE